MNKPIISALLGLLGFTVFEAGAQTPQVFKDTFNDNKRDTTKWTIPWRDATLMENSQVLRFYSHPTNASSDQAAQWNAQFVKKYNQNDILDMTCRVRVPHKAHNASPDSSYEMGIGFFVSTNSNFLDFTVIDTASNRQFKIYFLSETQDFTHDALTFPAPGDLAVFHLRVQYVKPTDALTFSWRPSPEVEWKKLGKPMKMSDLFGSTPRRIQPYATGYISEMRVKHEWNVWLDNFVVKFHNVPS